MFYKSKENLFSQALYELNKENLNAISKIDWYEKRRFCFKNLRIFCSYLFNGGLNRIIRRLKLKNNQLHNEYELKQYTSLPLKRIVVYTCVWGKYDRILEPYFCNPNIDYFILTDQEIPNNSIWKKMDIPSDLDLKNMSGVEINRYFKMHPHKLFADYEYSIYIDGNIRIVTDLMPLVADLDDFAIGIHDYPVDCIYNMKNAIIAGKRGNKKAVNEQIKKYRKEGFPKHFGAFECNVIVRKHNDEQCVFLMEEWWKEFVNTSSKRDQLSFPYVLWKAGLSKRIIFCLGRNVRLNPRFLISEGHKQK